MRRRGLAFLLQNGPAVHDFAVHGNTRPILRPIAGPVSTCAFAGLCFCASFSASAQTAPVAATPLAIVPVEGVKLTGTLEIANGKASIASSGTITAGEHAVPIDLPQRGSLRLCPTTKVSLTADSSVPIASDAATGEPREIPGLMIAMDHGVLETNFATGRNSDVILTPDFRIVISGPGQSQVQVRLGDKGDTCVDNRGPSAPYVSVSSIFDGGVYRVQPDQRVMFQHGSLREVVDQEKESCGCPAEPSAIPGNPSANEFPLAQSEGLAPLSVPVATPVPPGTVSAQVTATLAYEAPAAPAPQPNAPLSATPPPTPKSGFFTRVGHFFRKLFGG